RPGRSPTGSRPPATSITSPRARCSCGYSPSAAPPNKPPPPPTSSLWRPATWVYRGSSRSRSLPPPHSASPAAHPSRPRRFRTRQFGNVPERAYALLGHGRCLTTLGKPDAEAPLREARDLFTTLAYQPALAESRALLGESETAAV